MKWSWLFIKKCLKNPWIIAFLKCWPGGLEPSLVLNLLFILFCMWMLICPASFLVKTLFASLCCLCYFVKTHLAVFMSVYFWALYSSKLFVLWSLSWSLQLYSTSWSQIIVFQLCPLSVWFWLYYILCLSIQILECRQNL